MPTKKPRHERDASAGRYSGSDQQDVPDYGHADHKQGRAGKAHREANRRAGRGTALPTTAKANTGIATTRRARPQGRW